MKEKIIFKLDKVKGRESVGKSRQLKAKCHCLFSKQVKIRQKFRKTAGDALILLLVSLSDL